MKRQQRPVEPGGLTLQQAMMLDVLGQAPLVVHRVYIDLSGSINAAMLLSYVISRRAQVLAQYRAEGLGEPPSPFWFGFSTEACEQNTGLTRHQLDAARRALRNIGVLLERRQSTLEAALDLERLSQMLKDQSRAQWSEHLTDTVIDPREPRPLEKPLAVHPEGEAS